MRKSNDNQYSTPHFQQLKVLKAGLLGSGLREVKPKNLNTDKIFKTIFYQLSQNFSLNCDQMVCFSDDVQPLSLSSELIPCHKKSYSLSSVLSEFSNIENSTCLIAVGESFSSENTSLKNIAQSVDRVDPQLQDTLVQAIVLELKSLESEKRECNISAKDLVVQSNSGKFSRLDFSGTGIKSSKKHWKSLEPRSAPLLKALGGLASSQDGWGVAAVVVADQKAVVEDDYFELNMAISQIHLGDSQSVDFSGFAKKIINFWKNESGIDFDQIDSIQILSPYLSVVGSLIASLQGVSQTESSKVNFRAKLDLDPYLCGWNPSVSFLRSLKSTQNRRLSVDLGNFPEIKMVAMWL